MCATAIFCLTSCTGNSEPDNTTSTDETDASYSLSTDSKKIDVIIGETALTATLADNSSAKAFAELLGNGELTVSMHDYGSFEKIGNLPESIKASDEQITAEPGDIILYQDNQITIYYDTNSWNFTRLGKIDGVSKEKLKKILGDGDVSVTFRLHSEEIKKKKLVVCFSVTGNTETIAGYIKETLNADAYKITAKETYTPDDINYNNLNSRSSKEQNDSTARPELAQMNLDLSSYDTVYLGYPIWWGQAPKIIYTFLESYDFTGITIIPFCTSGGSNIGSSADNLHLSAPNAIWKTGKRFSGSTDKNEVAKWVNP